MPQPPRKPADSGVTPLEQDGPHRPSSAEPPILDYAAPGQGGHKRHDPYAALRYRDYRFFSLGWICAVIAFQMQITTLAYEVYQWTGSKSLLGAAAGIQAIPLMLLALPAGHLADRLNRRKIVIVGSALLALCLLGLAGVSYLRSREAISTQSTVWGMFALILISATCSTFTRPARSALLPQIVPRHVFNNAVAWNASIFEVSSMAGPALGGVVIAWFSPMHAYLLSSALLAAFVVFLVLLRHQHVKHDHPADGKGALLAGLRFVWRNKIIVSAMTLDLFAVLIGGVTYLIPVFAKDILHVGPVGYGCLRAAPALGAFTMALLLAHLPPMRRSGWTLLASVAAFGAATIVFALSHNFILSIAALFFTGVFDNISVVIRHTLIQVLTPDAMRGRVSAVNAVFIGASNELGGLESGLAAAWLGPVGAAAAGGAGVIVVVAAVATLWPQIRALGSLADLKCEDG